MNLWRALALAIAIGVPSAVRAADVVRLPAVEVTGQPRSYITITVPVPDALRGAERVSFEVRTSGLTEVLGRASGELRPSNGRGLVLTLRVPAEAPEGLLEVGEVSFRVAGSTEEYVVPLAIRIPPVRGYVLSGPRDFRDLRVGDRLSLVYHLQNNGNVPDTVVVAANSPTGWNVQPAGPRTIIIAPRTGMDLPFTVSVPIAANVGDHAFDVHARALRESETPRMVSTTLGVVNRLPQSGGFSLRPQVAGAFTSSGGAFLYGFELLGPVADDVTLAARFSGQPQRTGLGAQGLYAAGVGGTPLQISLTGPDWQARLGNIAVSVSDLTGAGAGGVGVSLDQQRDKWGSRAMFARPSANVGMSGAFVGLGHWRAVQRGTVDFSASMLEERALVGRPRGLSAFGAEFTSLPFGSVTGSFALAHRTSPTGSGLGAQTVLTHDRPGEYATLRLSHAPGGSAAFARATNEFSFGGNKSLTPKLTVDANYTQTSDDGRVLATWRSRGWGIGERYRLRDDLTLYSRLQGTRFLASTIPGASGGFGATDAQLLAGAEWNWRSTQVHGEVFQGSVSRRTELVDGRASVAKSAQQGIRADASRNFEELGLFAVGAGLQLTGAGVGIPGRSWNVSSRWDGPPMLIGRLPVTLDASANLQQLGETSRSLILRAGGVAALPRGFELSLHVERNPFFRDAEGNAAMIASFAITTSTRIFRNAMLGQEGIVFEDRNANGERDEGELGVRGVAVLRGGDRVVTRADGTYRLPASSRGRTTIDISTLPVGLMPHTSVRGRNDDMQEIPLVPTGGVRLDLRLEADTDGRLPVSDLSKVVVMLRDSTGFEWVGRRQDSTTVTFAGLPIGDYTLRLDVSNVGEPVRPTTEIPQIVRVRALEQIGLTVPLRGRTIRMLTPPSRQRGATRSTTIRGGQGGRQ